MDDIAQAFGLAPLSTGPGQTVGHTTIADLVDDLDWHHRAACRPELKPETITHADWVNLWFPPPGAPTAHVRAICNTCPVKDECLEANLHERDGIYGGMSARERQRIRGQRGVTRTKGGHITNHGTEAGYRAHRRRGEPACPSCLAGNNRAVQDRAAARRRDVA